MTFLLPLVLFLIPLAFSPGPGNLFFAALAARFGTKATVPALVGYHVATLSVTMAVGLGFELSTGNNVGLTKFLASLGAIYVLYLAWKLATSDICDAPQVDHAASFIDGFLLLLFNPKAYVIIALLFTQFPPSKLIPDQAIFASFVIATAFTIHNLVAFIVWIIASDKVGARFRSGQNMRMMNWVFGSLLGGVAIWLFVANWF
ncbi:LysE family translocator [Maritalea porphyrae]|jgi:threonine/homoserine/homoserine lactone efflux protein|uniref:LysE family translocator n=1 Tax=Maritalea porphyrae TaxID=880732 RepID=UPI0022AEC589|nr:LysE family translocator [Maritalea porphyrae]MCZ4271712.1 LysE family translocator [Maritalea porphyrae]